MAIGLQNLSRRRFLKQAGLVALAVPGFARAAELDTAVGCSKIKGFNYQPSYGRTGLELWEKFDARAIDKELGLGKKHFPRMNAIRYWLSWPAFLREPQKLPQQFATVLSIAEKHGLKVMPVLFNAWHSGRPDYGGIYPKDLLLPTAERRAKFGPYLEAIVGPHADDRRIFSWDLCNEPQFRRHKPEVQKAESNWLGEVYEHCKHLGAKAPLTVGALGIHAHGLAGLKHVEPVSDLLSIHPYWFGPGRKPDKPTFEKGLDDYVAFARKVNKPLLATETCWGSLNDRQRTENIRYTLGELKKRGIGWLVYALCTSRVADLHGPELGPVSGPGNLAFIQLDGTLRPGHAVFNEF